MENYMSLSYMMGICPGQGCQGALVRIFSCSEFEIWVEPDWSRQAPS